MNKLITAVLVLITISASAQEQNKWQGKFEQLDQMLPTPNSYRSSSGAPGVNYWQQRADYVITAELNDDNQSLSGSETITYFNNAPEDLRYLWLQLDQNVNKKGNEDFGNAYGSVRDSMTTLNAQYLVRPIDFEAGYSIQSVKDNLGNNLPAVTNNTMMWIVG